MSGAGTRPGARAAIWGTAGAFLLLALAVAVPALTGWNVRVKSFPPLHADWLPRLGPGTPLAVALGVAGAVWAPRLAQRLRWTTLLMAAFLVSALWLFALATVDGFDGIGTILEHPYEYLRTARLVDDVGATLREYVSRIPYSHPDNWPVHIAGHPPGALLFFVLLVRIGLGSGLAAGMVVLIIGATTVVAVSITLRTLASERMARSAAPFLVFTPAAIWIAVSADGIFMAVAAWGICCLAQSTRSHGARRFSWAVLAGLLLGYCTMMSYGLPLLGVLAVAVLIAGRAWWPLFVAAAAAIAVVGAFAVAGFAWWEAFPVLQQRYWDGVASRRPPDYWLWGNLAAFSASAGPAIGASFAAVAIWAASRVRGAYASAVRFRTPRVRRTPSARLLDPQTCVLILCAAAWIMVLLADLSNMSRAEVERIWLPFVPWVTIGLSLFASSARRVLLIGQIVFAIVVQSLLSTGW